MLLTFIALRWTWPLLLFLKGIDNARKSTVSYTKNTQSQRHLYNTKKRGPNCREGKILDLSQTDTSYYQVHKIQPIIKHRVLLLDFAITTQKPTEICQVSCKNQSRISIRVSDDTSSLARVSDDTSNPRACKQWHRQTNQAVTCVTNQTPPRVAHPPQTPINRSLPKAFQGG